MNKVSVIIPVYNVEKYIGRCLDSILNQTYSNLEVIVVNDCTPDNSMAIVESYAQMDSRIRIINHSVNLGLMRTRYDGVKESTGDYIINCDSDDWMPLDAIELLLNKAVESDADIVAGVFDRIGTDGKLLSTHKPKLSFGHDSTAVYKSLLTCELPHSLCGKIFRASLLRDHKYDIFDNMTNGEDALLFYQVVANINKMAVIEESVYYYYYNTNSSTTSNFSIKSVRNIQQVINYRYNIIKNNTELVKSAEKQLILSSFNIGLNTKMLIRDFLKGIDIPNTSKIVSLRSFSKYFTGVELLKIYLLYFKYSRLLLFNKI